jgi:multidrug efflux pump subunit AcrA (membrane-fusion protein)
MWRVSGIFLMFILWWISTIQAENLSGELVWSQQVVLRAPLSGKIRQVSEVGSMVQAGKSVCQLDNRRGEANLAYAESQWRYQQQAVEEANKKWQQAQVLYERMVLSDNALEEARTEYQKVQADLERLRAQKVHFQTVAEWQNLQAPWPAYVLEKWVAAGQTVVEGESLVRLGSVEQRVNVSTDYVRWKALPRGKKVVVIAGHKRYDGQILNHFLEKTPDEKYRFQVGFDCVSSCRFPAGLPVLVEINNHE